MASRQVPPESEDKQENPKRRFNQEQYEMLVRCSRARDTTEWNEWREANPCAKILLEGAGLSGAYLGGARLEQAWLHEADLRDADLSGANVQRSYLGLARLQGAKLIEAHMNGATLSSAHLEGANLSFTHLEGASFNTAFVDGDTRLWECFLDRQTDFSGVALANARVQPGLRSRLEGNVRRIYWQKWYQSPHGKRWRRVCRWMKWPVRLFWAMSDYGQSTCRLVGAFFICAALFALVYLSPWLLCGRTVANETPFLVANLYTVPQNDSSSAEPSETPNGRRVPLPAHTVIARAFYFSIVTMTTLGFGDMYAHPESTWGHMLLTVQVLLGYLFLAALVTRLAILFTST